MNLEKEVIYLSLYYKVVTEDLKSLGLLRANIVQYKVGKWVYPLEPLSCHPRKGGGLWTVKRKSDAFQIKKYLMKKYQRVARVFSCRIGHIIYQSSYRVKTNKVELVEEIIKN